MTRAQESRIAELEEQLADLDERLDRIQSSRAIVRDQLEAARAEAAHG